MRRGWPLALVLSADWVPASEVVRFNAITLWHIDAAKWAPPTASKSATSRTPPCNLHRAPYQDLRLVEGPEGNPRRALETFLPNGTTYS
jgi:hypothetical protein